LQRTVNGAKPVLRPYSVRQLIIVVRPFVLVLLQALFGIVAGLLDERGVIECFFLPLDRLVKLPHFGVGSGERVEPEWVLPREGGTVSGGDRALIQRLGRTSVAS